MIRLRLLIALLVGISMGVSSEVVQACAYTYDGPQLARVADGVTIAVGGALPQVSGPSSGRVERWSVTLGSSTPSVRSFVATEAGPVLKGPIADAIPSSLTEQLTLAEARSGAGSQIMENLGDASRLDACYGVGEWVKMEWTHRSATGNVTVHWFRNLTSGQNVEFKFK